MQGVISISRTRIQNKVIRQSVLLLLALISFAQQSLAEAPPDLTRLREQVDFPPRDIPKIWGTASNGLTSALKVPGDAAKAANGIPIELYFKNVGDKPLMISRPYDLRGEPWGWVLTIIGPEGTLTYEGARPNYAETLAKLNPGQVIRYVGAAKPPVWNTTAPGRYSLKVKYGGSKPSLGDTRPIWFGIIHSNEVEAVVE